MQDHLVKSQYATAQISDAYPPIMDGVAQVAKQYAHHLSKRLGPAYVVAPKVPGFVDTEGHVLRYPSVPIPGREPYRYGLPWVSPMFMHRMTNLPLSLVHAHSPFVAGSLALHVAQSQNIPLVATFHSKYLDDVRRMFPKFDLPAEVVRRRIVDFYSQADEVWVPNARTGDTLREYGFTGPMHAVYLGTDLTVPRDLAQSRRKAEEFLGLGPQDRMIMYMGQIILEKNLAFLIQAMKNLQDLGTDFRFVLVGEGYARAELEKQIQELGLRNVQFTGVIRDRNLIINLLSRAELFAFPSLYDNAPLVVREAAALGVPAVLLKDTTASEGMRDGENGFLCERDPMLYASKVKHIVENPEVRNRAGAGARQTLYRSWEEAVGEVADRYSSLIRRFSRNSMTA